MLMHVTSKRRCSSGARADRWDAVYRALIDDEDDDLIVDAATVGGSALGAATKKIRLELRFVPAETRQRCVES